MSIQLVNVVRVQNLADLEIQRHSWVSRDGGWLNWAEIGCVWVVGMARMSVQLWQFMLVALAGWINRQQQAVIEYLQEENRVLREQFGGKRLRFTDAQRRRLRGARAQTHEQDQTIARLPEPAQQQVLALAAAQLKWRELAHRSAECCGEPPR